METIGLVGGVVVLLAAATAGVRVLRRRTDIGIDPAIVDTLSRRVRAWWYLCTILAATIFIGETATVVLFGLISFWALREFITLTPTRSGDHRTLVCVCARRCNSCWSASTATTPTASPFPCTHSC
jgi:phosphatidate cytidylyltransferase